MNGHTRILLVGENRYQTLLLERELDSAFENAVIGVYHEFEAGMRELFNTRYDLVILDADPHIPDLERFCRTVQSVRKNQKLILLVETDRTYMAPVAEIGDAVRVVTKVTSFYRRVTTIGRDMLGEQARPGRIVLHRPAEVLAEGGDQVSPDISLLENDINNPLMTILGMTELLLQERGTYSIDARQKIQAIKHSAQRIKTTLSRLSRHSRWPATETSHKAR